MADDTSNVAKLAALQNSDDKLIEELAGLSALDYAKRRKEAAEQLGVGVTALDKVVAKKHRELGSVADEEKGQGRAVKVTDVVPWSEPVDGSTLAGALVAAVKSHVVLRDDQGDAIAFWILHTWCVNEFSVSPRLAVTSPTKGCGKTTVLRLLNVLTRRPKRAGSISPPALFRVVEAHQPTILLDETEKYVEHGSDLHALLNEGHAKGGAVLRVLGENLELREFAVYGAAAFARNGPLPDDLDQRSIVIELQRRRPDEPLQELRDDRCEPLRYLARMCSRWAQEHVTDMHDRDPDMAGLINRGADNWRPLFVIANAVGGDWPARIRTAAARLAPREASAYGVVLLADIKARFDADSGADRLASSEIAEALHALEGRPWAEWGRAGKPISPNQIARLLREFKIVPDTVRVGDRTAKGYYLHQFADAFLRYLGPQGVPEPEQRNKRTAAGTSDLFQTITPEGNVTLQKCEKSNNDGPCYGVTAQKGGADQEREGDGHAEAFRPVCEHCGAAEGPDDPVREYLVEGDRCLLHPRCEAEWSAP